MLKLRRILCPTDFSELSYEALRVASHLAARFKAHLDLLHVETPDEPANPLLLAQKERADGALSLPPSVPTSPVIPRSLTRLGKPTDEIVKAATEEGYDLIVMGTHGLTGWRHLVLGSVAEGVVRRASCPVLTIREAREEAMFCVETPRKILCSTDFSESSYEALRVASDFAREFGAELIFMHALEPFTGYSGMILEPAQIEAATVEETTQQLAAVLEVHAHVDVRTRPLVVWGGAADGIVEAARNENADLIVIATHGTTGWRHLLLGSVAETVVRSAFCPVLTVPVLRPATAPAATSWMPSMETNSQT